MNEQARDEARVKPSDLDEDVALPVEQLPKRNRKKKVIVFLALFALVVLTCVGGYALLRDNQVDLKANKRLPEKPSSGSDIQKAAFDSIRDSLAAPSPTPISPASGERVAPPIEPGIAATLAPPPEAIASPTPQAIGATQSVANVSAKPVIALTTTQSVRFAAAPKPLPITPKPSPVQAEESKPTLAKRSVNLPAFGAMLPVRLMGALYTLRASSLARFELTRDLKTETWQMRRGTVFIGDVTGGGADRAFVRIRGFIDPATDRLVKIEGDLLGDDGGAGLRGKTRRVSSAWARVLDRAAQAGVQIATSILNRGASSVIIATDPYGAVRSAPSQSDGNRSFVEVPAGAVGFVMVTTLPQSAETDSRLAESKSSKDDFADPELADLMTSADPARIRAALPRMTAELRQIAEAVLKEIEAERK